MKHLLFLLSLFLLMSCQSGKESSAVNKSIQLVTLDPGHFHAALVQKSMLSSVDSTVYVYAPPGNDLRLHLDRIKAFNEREENPTAWNEVVYSGEDFWERFVRERKGNVVVLSGNNRKKTEYILGSLQNNYHVLADKPMAIRTEDFIQLRKAFDVAREKNLLLYDIMTERFEITTILQRELAQLPDLFGELEKGTPDNPAVTKESVHHFYKFVSGAALVRPPWFMDTDQQGEGIVDVTTHLVDLVQWECFPGQALDTTDVDITSARRWTTPITVDELKEVTALGDLPDYIMTSLRGDTLSVNCNGEINYSLKGVHARVSVIWVYKAPEGGGDTHYSLMRGSKANLIIRQGAEQMFRPALYIELPAGSPETTGSMNRKVAEVLERYPGIEIKELGESKWEVIIPEKYREGHEAHFGRVMNNYINYLAGGKLPEWEVPNMIVKYYTTTEARRMAKK